MTVLVKAYCKDPSGKLAMWEAGEISTENPGVLEMVLHDATRGAEKAFGNKFRGPVLLTVKNNSPAPEEIWPKFEETGSQPPFEPDHA